MNNCEVALIQHDRDALLAEIASRYYIHDQSQQAIADQLEISRSNISRLLKEARERGIVEIFIRHPLGRDAQIERQLMERFALRDIGVVRTIVGDAQATIEQAAALAAQMLEGFLAGARSLGISWGTTVHAIAHAFAPQRRYDVEVVQMMGGVGSTDPAIDGPALAQRLVAERPGLGVLFVSGYTEELPVLNTPGGKSQFLAKPFSSATLITAVAELLESR